MCWKQFASGSRQRHLRRRGHDLETSTCPNAYAALLTATDGRPDAAFIEVPGGFYPANAVSMLNFACYYYQYDILHRVTSNTVFGQLRTETFAYTQGADAVQNSGGSYNPNAWTLKTQETLAKSGDMNR